MSVRGSAIVCAALFAGLLAVSCGGPQQDTELSRVDSLRRAADSVGVSYLLAAEQAYQEGSYRRALLLTDSARARAPELPDVHALRGNILTELRRFDEARKSYRRVLDEAPEYEGIWLNLANLAFRQGEFRRAISLYRNEVRRNPDARAYNYMGRAYEELGVTDSARWAYEQSIRQDSSFAEAYMRIGQLLDADGRTAEALEYSRRGLSLDSSNLDYRYLVGSQLYRSGRLEEAIPHLRRTAEERPGHHGAHYNLGQALLRAGREEEAEAYLSEADSLEQLESKIENLRSVAESNPKNVGAWLKLAHRLRDMGRYEEALQTYEVARSLRPRSMVVLGNIADMHQRLGHTQQAVNGYRTILEQDSTVVSAWFNLGVLFANNGQPAKARRAWKEVLQYQPDHRRARAYLSRLEDPSGPSVTGP